MKSLFNRRHRGDKVICQLCGSSWKHWQQKSEGGHKFCWSCNSRARTRLIPYAIEHFELNMASLLHIGPNRPEVDYVLSQHKPDEYVVMDSRSHAQVPYTERVEDITQTTLPDGCFQSIIIWHVMEHIPDDLTAIQQMHRLLKPGGKLLMSVPIHPKMNPTTYTVKEANTPDDFVKHYGHHDHKRACGLDYWERFERVFGYVSEIRTWHLPEADVERFGLSDSHVAWCFVK